MIVRPVFCRPFVGRRDELAFLKERRLEAASSHGGVVLIAGDAGIGKSRLIAEFTGSLAYTRWKVGSGACLEFGNRPYGPVLDALARVDARPFELGAFATKLEQFEAIAERFTSIAVRTALVLVIEDLHWADAATLDFLRYFGTLVRRARILVVASFRADEFGVDHPTSAALAKIARSGAAERVNVLPLHGRELQTFIDEALAGIEVPSTTRRAIVLAGEGNPFFTEELLASAVERQSARDPGRANVPSTIRATLLERLHGFDEFERRVIMQAAVIGRTFGLHLLATTLECEAERLLPALRRARDAGLIEESGPSAFRFRHVLTRDAMYGAFLGAEVPAKHRAIARALESESLESRSVEALAYHWWAAGDAAASARYNVLAGDAAARVYAHEDAIALYERALDLPGASALERGAIVEKIAHRRLVLASTEEGLATYRAAADLYREAGAYEREAVCRVREAMTAYTISLTDTSAPLALMLERLDPSEFLARSRVHLGIAWLSTALRLPTRAREHLDAVDPRAASLPDIAVRFHNVSTLVAALRGDVERFRAEHAAWLAAARASGLGALGGALSGGAKWFADFGLHAEARANVEAALGVARESRNRHAEECAHAAAALCYVRSGELALARAALEAVPPTTDNRVNVVFATAAGSLVGAHTGDDALVEKWFDRFEEAVAAAPEPECGAGFAEILVRRGRRRDAEMLLHRVLPECESMRGDVLTLLAVGRYGAARDRARARTYLERAAPGFTDVVEVPALALFDAYAARIEQRSDDAAALARHAADGFRRLGFPLLEAAAYEAAGDAAGAAALFRRCGAEYDARRLDGARAAPALLSPREREIAALAVDGRTNLEIAKALSITYKTVEKHLSSAYRKVGVSSRSALRPYVS